MSLIVQVNGGGAGNGSGGGGGQQPQSFHLQQSRDPQPSIITQIGSPGLPNQPTLSVIGRVPPGQHLSGLTRLTGGAPHLVQQHPQPLRMVHIPGGASIPVSAAALTALSAGGSGTTVTFPATTIRHMLPQSNAVRPSPQLPRSPIRQQHQTLVRHSIQPANMIHHEQPPVAQQLSQHRTVHVARGGHIRAFQPMKVSTQGGCAQIITGQRPQTLTMLQHTPGTGTLMAGIPSTGILTGSANLLRFPLQIQQSPLPFQPISNQQVPMVNPTATIWPPNLSYSQLFPDSPDNDESNDDGIANEKDPKMGEWTSKMQNHPLCDHNYNRPPLIPPPLPAVALVSQPSETGIFRDVLEEHVIQQSSFIQLNSEEGPQDYSTSQSCLAAKPETSDVTTDFPGYHTVAGEVGSMNSLPSKVQTNLNSIEEAGVGPMIPLGDDDNSQISSSSNDLDDHGGEDTETAPEAEGEEDSVTRCICDFLHDDGYMICCDKCHVWQHVVCMGLDKLNIPDEYLCEVCKPRPVDRKRARIMQSKKREELFKYTVDSSDEDRRNAVARRNKILATPLGIKKRTNSGSVSSIRRVFDKKSDLKILGPGRKPKFGKRDKSLSKIVSPTPHPSHPNENVNQLEKDSKMKKTYRKRRSFQKNVERKPSLKKGGRRDSQNLDSESDESRDGSADEEDASDDVDRNSLFLRSWIDQYEEAVTNHYSQELRARLSANKLAVLGSDLRSSAIGAPSRCNVSLKGNGVKILTASSNLSVNTPVIECKGKLMLASQYRAASRGKPQSPFVLFYQLSDTTEIAVDEKTYGNDSRFCRRSTNYNADLKHIIDKGSLHIFIVAIKSIEKNQEILLPPEKIDHSTIPLPSISADLREIKRPVNGVLNTSPEEEHLPSKAETKERKKKEAKSLRKLSTNTSQDEEAPLQSGRKTRAQNQTKSRSELKVKKEVKDEKPIVKEEIKEEPDSPVESSPLLNGSDVSDKKLIGDNPSKQSKLCSSVGSSKQGLPENKRLIVGVNTINYDASSSVKNKAKSREERKMEMIMKAFEDMERAQKRRKDSASGDGKDEVRGGMVPGKRRRKSSPSYKANSSNNLDSNLDASSADESKPEPCRSKRKVRKSGPIISQRRRSRIISGGNASALSTDEDPSTSLCLDSGSPQVGQFRFPKTKKSLMTDWLQECNDGSPQNDDDVSANYLKGNRSPPGIATHLLRSNAPMSPNKSVCSAKKRWLRQAISEDHTEEVSINGGASPSEMCFGDYVTPLKKRRLQDYQGEGDRNSKFPNGLKKKFFSTLVLDVLDRALVDMRSNMSNVDSPNSPSRQDHDESLTKDPYDESSSQDAFHGESPDTKEDDDEVGFDEDERVEDALNQDNISLVDDEDAEASSETDRYYTEESLRQRHSGSLQNEPSNFEVSPTSINHEFSSKPIRSDRVGESETEAEEADTLREKQSFNMSDVKTPETSSVFKSFFTSSVSIEHLEAQIEASQRARLEEEKLNIFPKTFDGFEPSSDISVLKSHQDKSEFSPEPIVVVSQQNQPDFEGLPKSTDPTTNHVGMDESSSRLEEIVDTKPKEKKRVSLADYKKRRQLSGVSFSDGQSLTSRAEEKECPGTPTLDEELAPLALPPTLNTLPLFEKMDKKTAIKVKETKVEEERSPSPQKRENLTERLRKEFGLAVEEECVEDLTEDDETSTSDSPAPPPPVHPPSSSSRARFSSSFLFANQKYPEVSSQTVPPPPPPPSFLRDAPAFPPPPPPPGSSQSLPPPPPPPSSHHISHAPPPPPSTAICSTRTEPDSSSHSRSNGGIGYYRKSSSSSKEYFSQGSSSRNYYNHGNRGRDHRDHRERDRDRDRDRDHHHHHRSSSSSRRNGFHSSSRSYY